MLETAGRQRAGPNGRRGTSTGKDGGMSSKSHEQSKSEAREPDRFRKGPGVVAPSNRVNVALPFGQIKVEEASRELAELIVLVRDLVFDLEATSGQELKEIRERATALAARVA